MCFRQIFASAQNSKDLLNKKISSLEGKLLKSKDDNDVILDISNFIDCQAATEKIKSYAEYFQHDKSILYYHSKVGDVKA